MRRLGTFKHSLIRLTEPVDTGIDSGRETVPKTGDGPGPHLEEEFGNTT